VSTADPFPADQNRIIKALERRIEALEAQVRQRPGAPVTKATAPFTIPGAAPSTPASGVQIGVSGGKIVFQHADGSTETIPELNLNLPGAAPTYPASFSSPATVSGTVQDTHYNLLRSDIVNQLFNPLRDLIEKGRASGLWLSS
jgi:hypothetical protein